MIFIPLSFENILKTNSVICKIQILKLIAHYVDTEIYSWSKKYPHKSYLNYFAVTTANFKP